MPITQGVANRMAAEKPFRGIKVVLGHFVALNSVALFEALWLGGAEISLCTPFQSKRISALTEDLLAYDFPLLSMEEAIQSGDYFIDVAGMLGQHRTPTAAVEVTRTGDRVYESLACPTISIDQSKLKYLEDFLGTGESFVRGWHHFRPHDALTGKNIVLFGYGKVGKGVAFFCRKEGASLTVIDIDAKALQKARDEGFNSINLQDSSQLQSALRNAQVIIGATGIPGAVGDSVPTSWLQANSPFFANIGIDEFGAYIPNEEILGGREVPINFHLKHPTRNHKIDPIQAAELLALEELIKHPDKYADGLHPLPKSIDNWVIKEWISYWPEEDLSGIEKEIELSEFI